MQPADGTTTDMPTGYQEVQRSAVVLGLASLASDDRRPPISKEK